MWNASNLCTLATLAFVACLSLASVAVAEVIHTQTYLSKPFELASGDVVDTYKSLVMPEGHIGMRNFSAEVVDENGNSVPLYEVYVHHWVACKYVVKKGYKELVSSTPKKITDPTVVFNMYEGHAHRIQFQEEADVKIGSGGTANESMQGTRPGSCSHTQDVAVLGAGAETRRTDTSMPAPYAIESGNPATIPEGYEEAWYLNMHAIDTRGAVDTTSCFECLCDAYRVTTDSGGRPLKPGYRGGLYCCYDKTHCTVKAGAALPSRKLHMRYTVTWVEWDKTVVPVRAYALDVTAARDCETEYDVAECDKASSNACIDRQHTTVFLPVGGYLIRAVMHQHTGGMGGILYDKNGVLICESEPIYGKGDEAGDEAGYLVGLTTCFPKPGSIYIDSWEEINFDGSYSAEQARTGVMSQLIVHLADSVNFIEQVIN